jgi:HEXXH motif-containing protein
MTSFSESLSQVDWARMAVPQSDGYDTDTIFRLATTGVSPLRHTPYARRETGGAVTFCDGAVAVRKAPPQGLKSQGVVPADPAHPNLPRAAAILARWPEVYEQFKRLIDTIFPYSDRIQARLGAMACGSSSHSYEQDFGSVFATVDDPFGLAQALAHEMAHQKLRAMGVSLEAADRLITNPPEQRFVSPIRKDKTRPMTAVFHAQYSFIHVTALDLHMLSKTEDASERTRILMLLARNVPRMKSGHDEIAAHIQTDDAGTIFVRTFLAWSSAVIEDGQKTLDSNGYGDS